MSRFIRNVEEERAAKINKILDILAYTIISGAIIGVIYMGIIFPFLGVLWLFMLLAAVLLASLIRVADILTKNKEERLK